MHRVVIPFNLLSAYAWPDPSANLTGTRAPLWVGTATGTARSWTHPGMGELLTLSVGDS